MKMRDPRPFLSAFCALAALVGPSPTLATSGGGEAQGAFVSVMVGTQQWVVARLLQPLLLDGGYAVVQTRVAEPWGQGQWRLTAENTLVVDCASPGRRVAVVQQATNTQPDGLLPPEWQVSGGILNQPTNTGLALSHLPFEALPAPGFAQQWPRPLRAPSEHRVAAEFACRAARLPSAMPLAAAEVAAVVRQSGGFDDVQALKCRASGRANPAGVDIEIRHSPRGSAVLLGEKWVVAGTLYEDHLALADGDLEVRLTRATGVLRLVLRSEMQTVGTGVCRTVPPLAQPTTGW